MSDNYNRNFTFGRILLEGEYFFYFNLFLTDYDIWGFFSGTTRTTFVLIDL